MERIQKNFGFGCMRLPMKDGQVDKAEMCRMVDIFLENGFNYFDTAHGYVEGLSEPALRDCLTSRYPRDKYILTDKLSTHHFTREDQIRPLFASQLTACGVEYFDFYLMHAQSAEIFAKYKKCRAYETALELKAEGKIRRFGISFNDRTGRSAGSTASPSSSWSPARAATWSICRRTPGRSWTASALPPPSAPFVLPPVTRAF